MGAIRTSPRSKEDAWIHIVEECFRREAGLSAPIPSETSDLIQSGILDSMAWVGFLRAVETASGVSDLGSGLNDRPASFASVLAMLRNSKGSSSLAEDSQEGNVRIAPMQFSVVTASSSAIGSRVIPSEEIDRAFGMSIGKLRHRAGIKSVAHAADGENELTLGA
jgi:hypothetical protein